MPIRYCSLLFRSAWALALLLVLAACTPGGQFDPTEMFNSDVFNSKTNLKGQRVPLFPNGVPGTSTGVPADLVKGYQPPPDQAAVDPDAIQAPPAEAAGPEAKPKPKPKPKPKVAIGRPAKQQAARQPTSTPTRIDVGAKAGGPEPAQSVWPAAPPTAPQQGGQFAWPAPPPAGQAQQGALSSQAAQPSQSIWPNPPAPGTTSQ
ncbi:MAG: hypothetical protein WA652_18815 [Xanthobacteraceae bacterium]